MIRRITVNKADVDLTVIFYDGGKEEPMERPLNAWLYVSSSRLAASDSETALEDIVSRARVNNQRLGLSGALLFTGTRFVQLLEGPADALAFMREKIVADERHADVRTIAEGPWRKRSFESWSLAYAGPSQFVAKVLEQALQEAQRDKAKGSASLLRLLREFSGVAV
jgi:hypothetical protein